MKGWAAQRRENDYEDPTTHERWRKVDNPPQRCLALWHARQAAGAAADSSICVRTSCTCLCFEHMYSVRGAFNYSPAFAICLSSSVHECLLVNRCMQRAWCARIRVRSRAHVWHAWIRTSMSTRCCSISGYLQTLCELGICATLWSAVLLRHQALLP